MSKKITQHLGNDPLCDICDEPISNCGESVKMALIDPITRRIVKFKMSVDNGYICPECVRACSITLGNRVPRP